MLNVKDLEIALDKKEFVFYYQPKVAMTTGCICGAEALLRWVKPDGSVISPAEFIPLAESSGFIKEITLAMFQKLIVDINIIIDFNNSLSISFNVSPVDLGDDRIFEAIKYAIDSRLVSKKNLEMEITESGIISGDEDVRRRIQTIRDMGIGLSMDDFGTGYSSIDTLSKWPFTAIKIDQGIIGRMICSGKDSTIAESSIRMAHELGIDVVGEGVETEECYMSLLRAGCTISQGYWISRPIPIHEFIGFINTQKRWPVDLAGLAYQAQLDHLKWRKSVIDGAFFFMNRKNQSPNLRGAPESDPTMCMLGKW